MKSSRRNLVIIITLFVNVVVLISMVVLFNNKTIKNDLIELNSIVDRYAIEYQSERGFGNDRFDIYSFELKEINEKIPFKTIDMEFQDSYNNFESMLENIETERHPDTRRIRTKIEKYIFSEGTKYLNIELEGTKKLYLYKENMNKGYCLILTI